MLPIIYIQIRKLKIKKHFNQHILYQAKILQKEILLLWFTDRKRDKHVNLLYVQHPCNDNTGHFA